MKKIILLLTSIIFSLTSCSNDDNFDSELNSTKLKNDVEKVGSKYDYNVKKTSQNEEIFKVSSINELEKTLESIKVNFETTKFKSIDGLELTSKSEELKVDKIIDSTFHMLMYFDKTNKIASNMKLNGGDPPLDKTLTIRFDNNFPSSNIYVTVNYSTNISGTTFTNAQVVSGSYGYSFGNTYNQTNVVLRYQNGTLVFEVTGQLTTSVGVGDFSLTGTNDVQFTGAMQLPSPSGGGSKNTKPSMYVRQQPL